MKKIFLIIGWLVWFAPLHAQKKDSCIAGVYQTAADLLNDRVAHRINTGKKGYKFEFRFPADLHLTFRIETPDTVMEFEPGSVFGYSRCGLRFRYYAGGDLMAQEDYYLVEETAGLVIYSSAFVSGDERFYSKSLEAPIRRLSMNNIEEDFSAHPKFVEEVRQLSRRGVPGELGKKDKNGRFEINRIYRRTVGK